MDVVRATSLRSLIDAMKAFSEDDSREQFTVLFARAARVLEVDDVSLARALRVSRPTISRWAAGKSAPHRLGRKPSLRSTDPTGSESASAANQLTLRLPNSHFTITR